METDSTTQNNNNSTPNSDVHAFEEFGVMPEIIKAIQELGWSLPRDIQAECIPYILGGGDVMAAAETGSGKTGAFALPVLQIVHETRREIAQPKAWNQHQPIRMNLDDRSAVIALSSDGLTVQNNTEQWGGVRANVGITKGQYFYEATIQHGGCRVGWATKAGSLDLGTDNHGFGFGFTGKKSYARRFDSYGEPFTDGDVIGCFLDIENGQISYSKNEGKHLGTAFEIPQNMRRNFAFYPCEGQVLLNFGLSPLKYEAHGSFQPAQLADASHIAQTTGAVSKKGRAPLALILEPTRELAIQIDDAITAFKKYLPDPQIDQLCLIPTGKDIAMAKNISDGIDIVTATPGKLIDFADSGKIDLGSIRFFVLDEADHLIDHHKNEIQKVWAMLPKTELQVLMFSATLHSPVVKEMGEKICKFPTWIDLKGKDAVPETVDHAFVWANPIHNKAMVTAQPRIQTDGVHYKDNIQPNSTTPEAYSEAVKAMKPHLLLKIINAYKMDQAMIFCRTKLDCDNLEAFLHAISPTKKGPLIDTEYSCCVVHADRSGQERNANVAAFKAGEVRFLICTDVAARGIDINQLPYVINYSLPDLPETYIHRIGRVGRADRMGLAISIVSSVKEKVWYHTCPSKGKSCNNTNLKDQGGCTIWYDEPAYWEEIQKRLGITVPHLDSNYRLAESDGTQYGQAKKGGEEAVFLTHINELQPLVAQLAQLEDASQMSYWNIKAKFSKKLPLQ